MTCCAIGPCADPQCYLCTVVAKLTQPATAQERKQANAARDGAPKLAGQKRKRPHA